MSKKDNLFERIEDNLENLSKKIDLIITVKEKGEIEKMISELKNDFINNIKLKLNKETIADLEHIPHWSDNRSGNSQCAYCEVDDDDWQRCGGN